MSEPMTREEMDEIRKAEQEATQGQWYIPLYGYNIEGDGGKLFYAFGSGEQVNADMRFIALSRTAVPRLLAEVDRLQSALDAAERRAEASEKHGEWQTIGYPDEENGEQFTMEFFVCSVCGKKVFWNFEKTPFCPQCGANMCGPCAANSPDQGGEVGQ